jgi:Xaa-Pro aminopeptidase
VIQLDEPELVAPRRARLAQAAEMLGVDSWLLTTSQAVRTVTGAWSDDVDLFGEWSSPIVAVGSTVLAPTRPPSDARLIDDLIDLLPVRGTLAVDRLGPLALARLAELRPDLTVQDAAMLLGAAKVPRAQIEIDALVEAHRRTEAVLGSMVDLVVPGVTERDLTAEFTVRAAEAGLDRMHLDTVFSVLPRDGGEAPWARGSWEGRSPYRELTTDRVLVEGDHVAFDAGVGYSGYTADVGWTLLASHPLGRGGAPGYRDGQARGERVPAPRRRARRLGSGPAATLALPALRGPRGGHRVGRAAVRRRRLRP